VGFAGERVSWAEMLGCRERRGVRSVDAAEALLMAGDTGSGDGGVVRIPSTGFWNDVDIPEGALALLKDENARRIIGFVDCGS
jgi:hypothetical protein